MAGSTGSFEEGDARHKTWLDPWKIGRSRERETDNLKVEREMTDNLKSERKMCRPVDRWNDGPKMDREMTDCCE